jgi:DnaJ-like protein
MLAFVLGVIALIVLLFAAYSFSKADPKQAARVLRYIGAGAALLFAVFLLIRGQIGPAVSIGLIGLGLLGFIPLWRASFGGRTQKTPGQVSRVRTAFLEMELDHDSGALRGQVLAGRQQGAALDDLDVPTLMALLREIDEDSLPLLAAYLDRRQPRWREDAPDDAASANGNRASRGAKMTAEEAYQILGIQPGATAQEISRAHRFLMKKLHPDQGGSTYLAARINEAKDVLIRGHR